MINILEKDFSYGPVPTTTLSMAGSGAIIITKIPVAFIKECLLIFDKDNNLYGKTKYSNHFAHWLRIVTS